MLLELGDIGEILSTGNTDVIVLDLHVLFKLSMGGEIFLTDITWEELKPTGLIVHVLHMLLEACAILKLCSTHRALILPIVNLLVFSQVVYAYKRLGAL